MYDAASAELPRVVAQLESPLSDKVLLAGVERDDTEAPVRLVVVVRGYSPAEEDEEGEWL